MLRFRIKELISDKSFREGRRVTMTLVAEESGVNRVSLSKMANQKGFSTVTSNLDLLCAYFNCSIADLVEYIPEQAEDK
ncbi:helix-turn-helix transcriptional regulator [Maribrevibacterium harenarium]|uniref:Helix-turn-helix transcriptional regulator n=2 Tax=Maribrevibacterium harenarium TaxID=2589817 RepID=A0A501W5L4_9GAMM|nr:helix-turn-helix transcriptional regulator [Maribrevibacterium harenarium]